MKHKSEIVLLAGILLIAILLRFVQLGSIPDSPDSDEVAIGYNAYSLLKTGKDEYGAVFPAVFRSFDDYKPPLYEYLTILPVWMFGLDTWVVRLPSAVFGVLGVLGVYFLVRELLELAAPEVRQRWRYLALLSTFFLAISPWHIQFSRVAFEANVGVTFNIWFVICFLRGLKKWIWFIPAMVCAVLAMYAYHSERVFIPLLGAFLLILFRKQVFVFRWRLAAPLLLGVLISIPLIVSYSRPQDWARLINTSSISDKTALLARTAVKLSQDKALGNKIGRVFDNSKIVYVQTILRGYLSHFSFEWLFLTGDNNRHHAPDMGLLYLADLPFLLAGMYFLIRKGGGMAGLLFFWFLIAPVAAAPTNQLPHAVRTMVFLPTFQIFTAIGILEALALIKARKPVLVKPLLAGLIFFYALNVSYYLYSYFVRTNLEYSQYWEYGYQQAVDYVRQSGDQYGEVVVSTRLGQPHMNFLFYLQYSPSRYLKEGGTNSGKNHFGKYYFHPIDWSAAAHDAKVLYIGTPDEISGPALKVIKNPDGSDAIKIAVK